MYKDLDLCDSYGSLSLSVLFLPCVFERHAHTSRGILPFVSTTYSVGFAYVKVVRQNDQTRLPLIMDQAQPVIFSKGYRYDTSLLPIQIAISFVVIAPFTARETLVSFHRVTI